VSNINLINRKEVLDFLEEDYGFWEYIRMISPRVGIDENEAIKLADEVRFAIRDTIESMPVVEERQETKCIRTYNGYREEYSHACDACHKYIATPFKGDKFKFCPHCGAQYKVVEDK
jgi:hypothetical protein